MIPYMLVLLIGHTTQTSFTQVAVPSLEVCQNAGRGWLHEAKPHELRPRFYCVPVGTTNELLEDHHHHEHQ